MIWKQSNRLPSNIMRWGQPRDQMAKWYPGSLILSMTKMWYAYALKRDSIVRFSGFSFFQRGLQRLHTSGSLLRTAKSILVCKGYSLIDLVRLIHVLSEKSFYQMALAKDVQNTKSNKEMVNSVAQINVPRGIFLKRMENVKSAMNVNHQLRMGKAVLKLIAIPQDKQLVNSGNVQIVKIIIEFETDHVKHLSVNSTKSILQTEHAIHAGPSKKDIILILNVTNKHARQP